MICEPTIDDATLAYVVTVRGAFESLRKASGLLGGLLILAAASDGQTQVDQPVFAIVGQLVSEADEQIRSVSPPPRDRHHHRHLLLSAKKMGLAFALADGRRAVIGREAVFAPLEAVTSAIEELRHASSTLPGLHMVDLAQSCCGCIPTFDSQLHNLNRG